MAEAQEKPQEQPDVVAVQPSDAHILAQLHHALIQASNNYKAAVFDLVCYHKLDPNQYTYNPQQGVFVRAGAQIPEAPKGDGPKAAVVKMRAKNRRKR